MYSEEEEVERARGDVAFRRQGKLLGEGTTGTHEAVVRQRHGKVISLECQ